MHSAVASSQAVARRCTLASAVGATDALCLSKPRTQRSGVSALREIETDRHLDLPRTPLRFVCGSAELLRHRVSYPCRTAALRPNPMTAIISDSQPDLDPPPCLGGGSDVDEVRLPAPACAIGILIMPVTGVQTVKIRRLDADGIELKFDPELTMARAPRIYEGLAGAPSEARPDHTPPTPPAHYTIRDCFLGYYRAACRRLALATRPGVKLQLRRFAGQFGPRNDPRSLQLSELERWFGLRGKSALARVSSAFTWAKRHDLIATNPLLQVRVESDEEFGTPITDTQFQTLLRACGGHRLAPFRRLLLLAYLVGPRPMELARMERRHVHIDRRVIAFPPMEHKTGRRTKRERQIVLDDVALRLIAWLLDHLPADENFLFLAENGRPWISRDGRATSLGLKFRRLRNAAALPEEITIYSLRHAYGTLLAVRGKTALEISAMMGNSPRIAERYIHLAAQLDHLVAAANDAQRFRRERRRKPKPVKKSRDLHGQRRLFDD